MIEKLKVVIKPEDWKLPVNELEMRCLKNLLLKVDELVDAVNGMLYWHENLPRFWQNLSQKENTENKEPADPYAEQRKWIGTLCRCWDSDINDDIWGILQDIKDNKTEKYYLYGIGYEHCEPVKPDDDIIYKGE